MPKVEIATTSPLPSAVVGVPYSHTLEATGGDGTYTWSLRQMPNINIPAGTGVVQIRVTNPDKQFDEAEYTYIPAPQISTLNPASGPETGGNVVVISGTDIAPNATVSVDGIDVPTI